MDTLKAAVIGYGVMGRNHARVYRELPALVGSVMVIDPDEKALEVGIVKDRLGFCWSDIDAGYDVMAKSGVEIASITCPTSLHAEMAIRAMELGIHVLVEKPIAHTVKDAGNMIDCAKVNDCVLMVGHIVRYDPITEFIKRMVDQDALGAIRRISARRIGPSPDRVRDVGVTVDLATHDIDAMCWILGERPVEVMAATRHHRHGEFEDQVDGWIRFSGGAVGIIEADWLTPVKHRSMVVCGSKGILIADYVRRTVRTQYEDNKVQGGDYIYDTMTVETEFPSGHHVEPLKKEIQAFVACVAMGCDSPISGKDGLLALSTALAMIQSDDVGNVMFRAEEG